MARLVAWDQIKDQYSDILVLGNGASVAVHKGFNYKSLKDEAAKNGWLSTNVSKVFDHLRTDDFELVINMLWHTFRINRALEVTENRSTKTYHEIRGALIRSVQKVHVPYDKIEYLSPMWRFMYRFETVVSVNYDLLVYWAMLAGNDFLGRCFKDCFLEGEFQYDEWETFRTPITECGHSTLVFYPHGNLCLASNEADSDIKIVAHGDNLLGTILDTWRSNEAIPLFVSEGTSRQKKEAIGRSRYLNTIYDQVLPTLGGNVLIYGWSMSENDEHLIRRLIKPNTKAVAVSVHVTGKTDGDIEETCKLSELKIHKYSRKAKVTFFNAEDHGCWIH
ncbi:MAG: DUF4917 family protein [Deltaproteobacteria bacterium]|nr:DUF4917 family protein [Deltaproteobacteria bacterium]